MALLALWNPNIQFLKTDGTINAGGKIIVTDHNDAESIPANYSDADGTTLNSSPIVLDSLGRATCYIDDGSTYDLYVKDANGATLWTVTEMTPGTETIVVREGFSVSSNDSSIAVTISVNADGVTNYDLSIQKEIDRAKEAEKGLAGSIEAEKNRAESAESALSKSIADETKRATEAEKGLADSIEAEKNRAESAESALSKSIADKAGTASPLMDGKASVGNSLKYAREDHVHPTDTSRASASHTHGSITNDGKIGSTADLAVVTGTSGAVTTADLTTASPTVPAGGTTTSLEFIDTVAQDSKGKISATKKAVPVDSTYSSTGTNPVNGKAIAAAIGGLDSSKTSTDGTNVQVKVTETDGKISAVNVTTDNTENKNNKVSTWQTTPDNTHYPSEKLVKGSLDAKADLTNSVAIFDGYVRRMNESSGWRRVAHKQFNVTNRNINALFRLYLIGSNIYRIGLGDLIVNIRFNSSGSAPEFVACYLMSHRPLNTSIKLKVVGVAGNAVVEVWFRPPTFSMLMLSCLGNGEDVMAKTKDWKFEKYIDATDSEPVEDTANHVYVFSGTDRSVQLNIASPTNDNLVAMDTNGLVKDSWLAKSSVESAIRKAGSAIQGVKVNNTTLTPDANKIVNVPLVTTSADGAMSAADKTKLDGIEAGTASPIMDGKASVGNSLKYAREDHVHPTDTNKLNADGSNATTVGVTAMMRKVPSGTGPLSDESSYFGDSDSDHAKIVRRPVLDIWNYVKDNLGPAGSKDRPVYFDGGVPKECDTVLPCSIIDSGTATGYGVYVGGNSAVGSNTRCYCAFLLTATASPDWVAHTYIGTFTFRHGSFLNYELKCLTGTPNYPMRIAVSYNKNSDSTNLGVYVIPADPTVNTYANYKLTSIASAAFTWACTAINAADCAALDNDGAKPALVPIRLFFDGGGSNVATTGGSWLPTFDKGTINKCRGIVDMSIQVDLSVIGQTTYIETLATYEITLVNSAGTDILSKSMHQKGRMPRQTKSSTSGGTVDISHTHRFVFPITESCNLFAGYRPKITLPSNYPLDSKAKVSVSAICSGIVHPYYGNNTSF